MISELEAESLVGKHSLAFRIVVLFSSLIALILFATLFVVSVANLHISRQTVSQALLADERVFDRLLAQRSDLLISAAQVMARDYGLRDAVATGDTPTIASALKNHGARIHADLVMLSGLDSRVQVDTVSPERMGQPYPFGALLAQANLRGSASGIEQIDGRLYQLVAVPVKAPIVIGWVTMGFAINDQSAADLQALAGPQVSFLGDTARGRRVLASSLSGLQRQALDTAIMALPALGSVVLAGEKYEVRLVNLGAKGVTPIHVLLARSMSEAMQPFYRLQYTLVALALAALAISILAGTRLARRITDPLRQLTLIANKIRKGEYFQDINVRDNGEIGVLAGSFSHMQKAIAERELEITKLAFQDRLTELPNRVRFIQQLTEAIAASQQDAAPLTVLVLNLDRFHQINDTLGHPMGDQVLIEVGKRLQLAVRQNDKVARLSGDEFALLLPALSIEDSLTTVDRIHKTLDRRFELNGRPLDIRAGIGVAGFPQHAANAIDLLRCADLAMYRAKRSGQRQLRYDVGMQHAREAHLSLLGELQQAISRDELTLYFQPKVSLADGTADEAEALVRWHHPQRGFVSPVEFIPFAEQTGYIKEITKWVLTKAIAQVGDWNRQGLRIRVSVNLSTLDLLDEDLPAMIELLLAKQSVGAPALCLEITESGLMEAPEMAMKTLMAMRAMGLALAIDDYGTGYSSLAYIRRLPVTELKIDRAFVIELARNERDAQIVQSTIDLGHRLGLHAVAEGVEDLETVEILRKFGCDRIQGYVFGKPMSAKDFVAWSAARV